MQYNNLENMLTQIDESIKVVAIFGDGRKLKPIYFLWKSRKYKISQIAYTWISQEGESKIHHFSVIDTNDDLFEICYNNESMIWKLANVETEG